MCYAGLDTVCRLETGLLCLLLSVCSALSFFMQVGAYAGWFRNRQAARLVFASRLVFTVFVISCVLSPCVLN